jgi:hypothetical protein
VRHRPASLLGADADSRRWEAGEDRECVVQFGKLRSRCLLMNSIERDVRDKNLTGNPGTIEQRLVHTVLYVQARNSQGRGDKRSIAYIAIRDKDYSCGGFALWNVFDVMVNEAELLDVPAPPAGEIRNVENVLCETRTRVPHLTNLASLHVHRIDRFLILHFPTYVHLETSTRSNKPYSNPARQI